MSRTRGTATTHKVFLPDCKFLSEKAGSPSYGGLLCVFLSECYDPPMDTDEERFAAKISVDENDCWNWLAGRTWDDYASFGAKGKDWRAVRWAYVTMIGEIPEGLTLDHLCRNRGCVNPFHCEPVPNRVNVLRGNGPTAVNARRTHCKHGHKLAGENLRVRPDGRRQCRACWY